MSIKIADIRDAMTIAGVFILRIDTSISALKPRVCRVQCEACGRVYDTTLGVVHARQARNSIGCYDCRHHQVRQTRIARGSYKTPPPKVAPQTNGVRDKRKQFWAYLN